MKSIFLTIGSMAIISFCVLGVLFSSVIVHEGIHVLQSKEPISICYDFQQNTVAHVLHDTNYKTDLEWKTFKNYTEKWASIGQYIFMILGGMILGILTYKGIDILADYYKKDK